MNTFRWRAWLMALAIFLFGLVAGGAVTTLFGLHMLRAAFRAPATGTTLADRAADRIGAELTRSLQLTPDETARVQTDLQESAARMKALRVRVAGDVRDNVRLTVRTIAADLPPEKRIQFYRLMIQRFRGLDMPPPVDGKSAAEGSAD